MFRHYSPLTHPYSAMAFYCDTFCGSLFCDTFFCTVCHKYYLVNKLGQSFNAHATIYESTFCLTHQRLLLDRTGHESCALSTAVRDVAINYLIETLATKLLESRLCMTVCSHRCRVDEIDQKYFKMQVGFEK